MGGYIQMRASAVCGIVKGADRWISAKDRISRLRDSDRSL
jgi:hypothetical protein